MPKEDYCAGRMSLECPQSRPCKAHPTSPTAKRRPATNSAAPSSQRKAAPKDSTISSMAKGPIYKRPNLHRRSSHSRSGGERRTELSSRCQAVHRRATSSHFGFLGLGWGRLKRWSAGRARWRPSEGQGFQELGPRGEHNIGAQGLQVVEEAGSGSKRLAGVPPSA